MNPHYQKVIGFAQDLGLEIKVQEEKDGILVVHEESKGIYNMILNVDGEILVMEQLLYRLSQQSEKHFLRLLQLNRKLIHGAFVIDDEAQQVLFRDSLQVENLDFNEFEGSINALSLGLAEFSSELLALNKG